MFSIAGHREGDRLRAQPQRNRDRHRRQHVGCVVFLVDGLVADYRPAGGLDHLDVQAVLGIEAERRPHDDRRRAGDRDEAYFQILFLRAACFRKRLGRRLERKELRDGGKRGRGPDRFQERPARGILRKHRAHDSRSNDALVTLLEACHRLAAQRQSGMIVFGRGTMLAAYAARPRKLAVAIEGIVKGGHAEVPRVVPSDREANPATPGDSPPGRQRTAGR